MRRGWFSLLAVLSLLVVPTAYGQFFEDVEDFVAGLDYYVGFDVGGSFGSADVDIDDNLQMFSDSDSDDDGVVYGTAKIGAETGKWRADLEFTLRDEMEFSTTGPGSNFKTNVNANTLLVNAYYDLFAISDLTFFVGGGIGASFIDYDTSDGFVSGSDKDTDFAWQVGIGADYEITEEVSIEGGYRYIDLGEGDGHLQQIGFPNTNIGRYEVDLDANEIYLGFRYRW